MTRPLTKWDRRFLDLAKHVATWSKDPSTKVGAVITRGNLLVSVGFNGPPHGAKDEPDLPRERRLLRTVHAEINSILHAPQRPHLCRMYVSHPPCAHCAAAIVQAGIFEVVAPTPAADFRERWIDHFTEAESLFRETGVELLLTPS